MEGFELLVLCLVTIFTFLWLYLYMGANWKLLVKRAEEMKLTRQAEHEKERKERLKPQGNS